MQELRLIERTATGFEESVREVVRFVPLQPGVVPSGLQNSTPQDSQTRGMTYHGRRDKSAPTEIRLAEFRKAPLE